MTGEGVEIAFVDQGYTGETTADAAGEHSIKLEVAPLPTVKRGFVFYLADGGSSEVSDECRGFAAWLVTISDYLKR